MHCSRRSLNKFWVGEGRGQASRGTQGTDAGRQQPSAGDTTREAHSPGKTEQMGCSEQGARKRKQIGLLLLLICFLSTLQESRVFRWDLSRARHVSQGSVSHLQMVTPAEARRLSGEKQVARASGLVLLEEKPSGKGTCLQVLTFTAAGVILASKSSTQLCWRAVCISLPRASFRKERS